MIKSVHRICTACWGLQTVEIHRNPDSPKDSTKPINVQCEACEGRGYLPTGHFIIEESPFDKGKDFITQVKELPELDQRVIYKARL